MNGYAERLRRKGRTDWFGFVLDLDRPTLIAPPGSTQPILGWERVYFVDGRRLSATFAELQIDCEEDRVLRVLVGMLREDEKRR